MKYWINYSLANLRVCKTEFISHLFRVGNINNVVKDVVADTFFNNPGYYSKDYAIFFRLLFSDYY